MFLSVLKASIPEEIKFLLTNNSIIEATTFPMKGSFILRRILSFPLKPCLIFQDDDDDNIAATASKDKIHCEGQVCKIFTNRSNKS